MVIGHENKQRIDAILVQETLWTIEDNVKIILESVADHEAELIRLRHSINSLALKLEKSRSHEIVNTSKEAKNGRK
ncbi:MAG: hypothetical protein ABIK83_04270 [Candidatus Zixiibacteriota bacterium]